MMLGFDKSNENPRSPPQKQLVEDFQQPDWITGSSPERNKVELKSQNVPHVNMMNQPNLMNSTPESLQESLTMSKRITSDNLKNFISSQVSKST